MEEVRKPIEGYEWLYEVGTTGKVRSLRSNIILRSASNKTTRVKYRGYQLVHLSKRWKNKSFLVHRLVAQAFIGRPEGYNFVNHKDNDNWNNNVENLERCTQKQNLYHAIEYYNKKPRHSILDVEKVKEIRRLRAEWCRYKELVERFWVSRVSLENIVYRKTWKFVD